MGLPTTHFKEDTLSIRFKLDSTQINLRFANNLHNLEKFEQAYREHFAGINPFLLQLDIYAGASPEGTAQHNRYLGQGRGESILRILRERLGNRLGMVYVHNEGARWKALEESVAASNEPWKEAALRIIRQPASGPDNRRDPRETQLRSLRWNGELIWPVLLEKYLAPLRSGGSAIFSYHPERDTLYLKGAPAPPVVGRTDTLFTFRKDTVVTVRKDTVVTIKKDTLVTIKKDTLLSLQVHRDTVYIIQKDTVVFIHDYPDDFPYHGGFKSKKIKVPADQTPAWAVKTNLLLLGAAAPNVQVEYPLGDNNRWSVEGEFIFPWWTYAHNAYAEQVLNLGVEFRYWLGKREYHRWLDGWHLGLAGAFGYYDVEWKSKGFQGEHVNFYFNVGYQHRWGKRKQWGIDFGIGLGVLYTPRYRFYLGSTLFPETHTEEYDDHLMYQNHGTLVWPGGTHINATLMYFFDLDDKKRKTKHE